MTIGYDKPQANRVKNEQYLTYPYKHLELYEDFSDGMARKTKYYLVLKNKKKTIYLTRGSQQHNLHYAISGLPEFEGQLFTSPFKAAKTVDELLDHGKEI